MLISGAPAGRMTAGTIVAVVAGNPAPTTLDVDTMTVGAVRETGDGYRGAMLNGLTPVGRMTAGTIVALVTADAAGAALVIDAVAVRAGARTIASDQGPVLRRIGPTVGMASRRSVVALVTADG